MVTQVTHHPLTRAQIVGTISNIRREWETASLGNSLVETNGSVGYLLVDFAVGLGLSGDELKQALGELADELADSLNE
jgi:hypothetical protein